MKHLVTHADDFGASPGTNDAILDAVAAGFIRNVGVMAVGPHLAYRLDELRERATMCCIGLHTMINSEWASLRWGPVLDPRRVPSLVRADGTFYCSPAESAHSAAPTELLAELAAQLERLRAAGLTPRYLDTHMRFNEHVDVNDLLEDFCRREDLVFWPGDALPSFRPAEETNWLALDGERLAGHIATLPSDTAAWCFHPAYADDVSAQFIPPFSHAPSTAAPRRAREAAHLCDARWVAALRAVVRPLRHDEVELLRPNPVGAG